jgi:hypothetical protein
MGKIRRRAALAAAALLCCGCGARPWPFGGEASERAAATFDAIEYRCTTGRGFYLRVLENGAAVWLILPEREIRLERTGAGPGTRYAWRQTRLEIEGEAAVLFEGPTLLAGGCQRAESRPSLRDLGRGGEI